VSLADRRAVAALPLTATTVDYRISPDDRASFKRCRRQWDFASAHRRNLEAVEQPESSQLSTAFAAALAVYYYPGTWDWQHELKQSLVHKSLQRSLQEAGELARATSLIDTYDRCAVTVDDFAPVKIGHDVAALVRDPSDEERGLLTPDGSGVTYTCRVDLLAVDAADEYWVVCHQIVDEWQTGQELVLDEAAIAACWAWEQDYIGMEIAGTIHNEVRLDGAHEMPDEQGSSRSPQAVAQHEPSGGGRSIPQHVRLGARRPTTRDGGRFEQRTAGLVRRTRIRRSRDEIAAAGDFLAAEAVDMVGAPAVYPNPGPHCLTCEFMAPCLSMFEGNDPEPVLATHFRRHADNREQKPRLGQATWGFGRGAAPPDWRV
jgi:hypothetical protein